jgi:spore coat-associated protein N
VRVFSFRTLRVTGLVMMLALAGLTAAFAATGHFPLTAARNVSNARALGLRAAGSLTIDNSLDGQALLNASAMSPGESRVGQVTIANSGNIPGDFTLLDSALSDSGSVVPFSTVAQLLVQDVTNPGLPVTIYSGTLAGLGPIALGSFAAGEARTYQFTVTFPNGTPAQDNPLQGATTTVENDWAASAPDDSTPTDPTTPVDTTSAPVLGASGDSGNPPGVGAPAVTGPAGGGGGTTVSTRVTKGGTKLTSVFKAKITASLRRHIENGRVDFVISCGMRCSVSFGGTIRIPPLRRAVKIAHVNFVVPAGARMRVEVRIAPRLKAGVIRSLEAHRRPTITAQITARAGKHRSRPHRRVRFIR